MTTQFSILFIVLILALSSLTLGQRCYNFSAYGANATECQAPPTYTYVNIIADDPYCNYNLCVARNDTGISEILSSYTRNLDEVIKPARYVEVMRFSDENCTSQSNIEYFEADICRAPGNYATARVRRYHGGCGTTPTDDVTYNLEKCELRGGTYALVRCGTFSGPTPSTGPTSGPTTTSQSVAQSHPQLTALLVFAIMCLM